MMFLLLMSVGLVVILMGRAFHHNAALRREWEFYLAPWGLEAFENYEIKAAAEEAAIGSTHRRAACALTHEEAVRILDVGLGLVERTTENWVTLLRAVGLLSRMADAVTPLSPLNPWAFRMPALRGMALFWSIVHYLVITTGERLRLRAYVLRGCWKVAKSGLVKQTDRIRSGKDAWKRLEAARRDLRTTRMETLRSFQGVLLSLNARPAGATVRAEARRG